MPKIYRPPQPYDHAAWLRDVDYWLRREGAPALGPDEKLHQMYLLGMSAKEAARLIADEYRKAEGRTLV